MATPQWSFFAASLRTGRIIGELPLVNFSGQCRLDGGRLSASMPLMGRTIEVRRALLSATSPGIMTVVADRGGRVMGEWLIWTRDRGNGKQPVDLTGVEVRSFFKHIVIDGFTTLTNIDETALAQGLLQHALDRPPGIACDIETPLPSGRSIATAEYDDGSAYVGDIVDELAIAVDGFDWYVDTEWDNASPVKAVKRTARAQYPRRGRMLNASIDVPLAKGGSGVTFNLTEDAERLATTAYVTGNTVDGAYLLSRGLNADLLESYPALERIDSRSDYDDQDILDAVAAAEAAASRTPDAPTTVSVLADGDLQLGSYIAGDSVTARVEACANFPDGYAKQVRILGFTMTPPADGKTETVQLEIEGEDGGFGI